MREYKWTSCIALATTALVVLGLTSCNSASVGTVVQASGRPGEVMLVMGAQELETQQAYKLVDMLEQEAPSLPQVEPSLRVTSRITHDQFGGMMRLARTILMVNVDKERYTKSTLKFGYNEWAKGQIVISVNTPSLDSLASFASENEELLMNLIVRHELYRFASGTNEKSSQRTKDLVDSLFKHTINVPASINKQKVGKDFLWMSNASMDGRTDLMVYTFPYTKRKDLEMDRLVEVRDSVLRVNIPGEFKDSYPSTVKTGLYFRRVTIPNQPTRSELRGLWQMEGGAMMGGPFVMQAYHNEADGKVYVFEGFVYRPNEDKLNLIRTIEAALYTARPSSEKSYDPELILASKYSRSF